ncbi:MAG: 50S ribosomal protein L35 [Planctomycetales bacterium]|jgi:large subunit ribosomal protein L35
MPKQKTHKGIKKRFKITASGLSTKRSCNRGHILSKKNGKRKRMLRKGSLISGAEAKHIINALRPCS